MLNQSRSVSECSKRGILIALSAAVCAIPLAACNETDSKSTKTTTTVRDTPTATIKTTEKTEKKVEKTPNP